MCAVMTHELPSGNDKGTDSEDGEGRLTGLVYGDVNRMLIVAAPVQSGMEVVIIIFSLSMFTPGIDKIVATGMK